MSERLPIVISDRAALDALCRAWLGFDSASVERLRQRAEAGAAFFEAAEPYIRQRWTVLSSLKRQQVESEEAWIVAYNAMKAYEAAVQADAGDEGGER